MSVLNRIEIANWLNIDDTRDWRPDYRHVVLNLSGQSTAIQAHNGTGKTRMTRAMLALLARDREFTTDARSKMAPRTASSASHIRIEVLHPTDVRQEDILARFGAQVAGETYVFGMYGYSGDGQKVTFYKYSGRLEDCPPARRDGHRITLVSDEEFRRTLRSMSELLLDAQEEEWLSEVAKHFDTGTVRQMIEYQKKGAGDSTESFFKVRQHHGERYDESFFFDILAPELLVGTMGTEALEGERRFEDTVLISSRRISQALTDSRAKQKEMEETERALRAVELVADAGRRMTDARNDYQTQCRTLSNEAAFLKRIVVDYPVPGIPSAKLPENPETAIVARELKLQADAWILPDWTIASITGEDPSRINERANRQRIEHAVIGRQAIEIPCDHGLLQISRPQGGGHGNQGYREDAAAALIRNAPRFAEGWTKESAERAIHHAFAWALDKADTNFSRRKVAILDEELKVARDELTKAETELGQLETALEELQRKRSSMDAARYAYDEMARSGFFSAAELQAPQETGKAIATALTSAEKALHNHIDATGQHRATYVKWQRFINENGEDADPGRMADALEAAQRAARDLLNEARSTRSKLEVKRNELDKLIGAEQRRQSDVAKIIDRFDEPRQGAARFAELFPGEEVIGLLERVKRELRDASNRHAELQGFLQASEEQLQKLEAFRAAYPGQSPSAVLKARNDRRDALSNRCRELRTERDNAIRQRSELDRAQIAAGDVSRRILDEAGSDAKPLHAVIEELGLEPERRRLALTHFSGLLFAPVLDTIEAAEAVARKLHAKDLPAPVFSWSELGEFCLEGEIRETKSVAYSYMLGARTRPVDCLLDPGLVEREKAALDERIAYLGQELDAADAERGVLAPDHPDTRLIEAARQAVETGLEERRAQAIEELRKIAADLPRLEERASERSTEIIRGAERFSRMGGEPAYQKARQDKETIDAAIQRLEGERAETQEALTAAETAVHRAESAHELASAKMSQVALLKELAKFARDGGPAFMRSADAQRQRLETERDGLSTRGKFNFALAQASVETAAGAEARLDEEIRDKSNAKRDLLRARTELSDKIREGSDARDGHRPDKDRLDDVARRLIDQHRKAQAALSELEIAPSATIEETQSKELVTAISQATRLHLAIEDGQEDDIVELADELREDVEKLDIGVRSKTIEAARKVLDTARKELHTEIRKAAEDKELRLASNERDFLNQAREEPAKVADLYRHLEKVWNDNKRVSDEAHEALVERREELASALKNMTTRLTGNFETMRRAMNWKSDGAGELIEAGVQVKAAIHSDAQTKVLLDEIVDMIERAEATRQDAIQHGDTDALKTQEQHDEDLKERIRRRFYRGMFSETEIRMRHPELKAGRPDLLKKTISTGQQNAVMLMLMLKLADFAIERDVRIGFKYPKQRRKAKALAQKVVIIDGLFSNLSNRELIKESLRAMAKVRGNFQLIGLIHNPHYFNDPDIFPNHTVLVRNKQSKSGAYVYVVDDKPTPAAALGRNDGEIESLTLIAERVQGAGSGSTPPTDETPLEEPAA